MWPLETRQLRRATRGVLHHRLWELLEPTRPKDWTKGRGPCRDHLTCRSRPSLEESECLPMWTPLLDPSPVVWDSPEHTRSQMLPRQCARRGSRFAVSSLPCEQDRRRASRPVAHLCILFSTVDPHLPDFGRCGGTVRPAADRCGISPARVTTGRHNL